MTWHTTDVELDRLPVLLAEIRSRGGTITSSRPHDDCVCVTWTTAFEAAERA